MNEAANAQLAGNLQKNKCAGNICLNDGGRLINAAIDMRFCREMNDYIAACHCGFDCRGVTNVASDERIIRIVRNGFQVSKVAGVCKLVEVSNRISLTNSEN